MSKIKDYAATDPQDDDTNYSEWSVVQISNALGLKVLFTDLMALPIDQLYEYFKPYMNPPVDLDGVALIGETIDWTKQVLINFRDELLGLLTIIQKNGWNGVASDVFQSLFKSFISGLGNNIDQLSIIDIKQKSYEIQKEIIDVQKSLLTSIQKVCGPPLGQTPHPNTGGRGGSADNQVYDSHFIHNHGKVFEGSDLWYDKEKNSIHYTNSSQDKIQPEMYHQLLKLDSYCKDVYNQINLIIDDLQVPQDSPTFNTDNSSSSNNSSMGDDNISGSGGGSGYYPIPGGGNQNSNDLQNQLAQEKLQKDQQDAYNKELQDQLGSNNPKNIPSGSPYTPIPFSPPSNLDNNLPIDNYPKDESISPKGVGGEMLPEAEANMMKQGAGGKGMPYYPMGGMGGGMGMGPQQNQQDRQQNIWLSEKDDIWGTKKKRNDTYSLGKKTLIEEDV